MNKHAAEKIASEYYNLGVQLALQNAGLLKTADPILNRIKDEAFADATGGLNAVPYRSANVSKRTIADKYDMSMDEIKALSRKGKDAARFQGDFGKALGENNSAKAFGLPHGTAQVPYRN